VQLEIYSNQRSGYHRGTEAKNNVEPGKHEVDRKELLLHSPALFLLVGFETGEHRFHDRFGKGTTQRKADIAYPASGKCRRGPPGPS
jgi:hypothetical protein